MKKQQLLCIALTALVMTSCNDYREGESITDELSETALTAAAEETTAETTKPAQTASDEKTPQAADLPMEIKTYEPFGNASYTIDINKIDQNADSPFSTGIVNFLQELKTARQFMQADYAIYDSEDYTDTGTVREGDDGAAFVYKPLKTEIAKNEDELFSYLRKFFTQNYISNEELRNWLFVDEDNNTPRYKTIDGQLCIRCGYDGVMTTIEPDKIWVLTLGESGEYLSIAANAYGVDYPPYHAIMSIQLSNEQSWLLDSLEFKKYDQALCDVVFNGLSRRVLTLEMILKGYTGAKPLENPRTIVVNGESYTEAEALRTIDLMREFFAETFAETIYYKDKDGNIIGTKNLREDYTKKYIDDVYIEQDGVVYRRDSAPLWHMPYYTINTNESIGSGSRLGDFNAVIDLGDYGYYGEKYEISINSWGEVVNGKEVIYEILVTSELPIKETGKHFKEVIKPVIDQKREELNLSDDPFGVTDIYSGTRFDYNNDGHDDYVIAYGLYAQFQLVIIDSQNGDILFDDRIMTHLLSSTGLEIYRNSNSEYAFKITLRNEKPVVSHIDETIQIITASEECIFEALYNYETGDFVNAYDNAYNEYTQEEYIQKQEELLNGYEHYADIEWSEY